MLEQATQLALDHAESSLPRDSVLSYIERIRGVLLGQSGDWLSARKHFAQAVEWLPTNSTAHYLIGVALHETGQLEDARISYINAIILDPDFRASYMALGDCYTSMGRHQKALDMCNACLRRQPDAPVAQHVMVRAICGLLLENDYSMKDRKILRSQALASLKAAKVGRPKDWSAVEANIEKWLQPVRYITKPLPDLKNWKNWKYYGWRP